MPPESSCLAEGAQVTTALPCLYSSYLVAYRVLDRIWAGPWTTPTQPIAGQYWAEQSALWPTYNPPAQSPAPLTLCSHDLGQGEHMGSCGPGRGNGIFHLQWGPGNGEGRQGRTPGVDSSTEELQDMCC